MDLRPIRSALISVYYKDGLEPLLKVLAEHKVKLYSTGGTQAHLEQLGYEVEAVEHLTGYPSILDGRVKTLHPAVFGGILARREPTHLAELEAHSLPEIDLVVVDLYPFEETVAKSGDEAEIIEKIDIGGISLIRAAAKNFRDVAVVPSRDSYLTVVDMLRHGDGALNLDQRKRLAKWAFAESARYDAAISRYFMHSDPPVEEKPIASFQAAAGPAQPIRYGENPHQTATFFGDLAEVFTKLHGKELSYNNLVDVDAAIRLLAEFETTEPTAVVIKHTNACGVARKASLVEAWQAALAADPTSAYGGILGFNKKLDVATAQEVDKLFCEVVVAPGFEPEALKILQRKKDRILLSINSFSRSMLEFKSLLGGVIEQECDLKNETLDDLRVVTKTTPTQKQIEDLLFATICAKHLKSNTIALARDRQLLSMGCGQTSRVDALRQAIAKAQSFGFSLKGAVMASDAFFPFPDCVEIASEAGIVAVIQPGGSKKDQDSIDAADTAGISMIMTGIRHFKH